MSTYASLSLPSCSLPARHELPVDPSSSGSIDDDPYGILRASSSSYIIDGSFGSLWIDADAAVSSPTASTTHDTSTYSLHIDFATYQFDTSAWAYANRPHCSAPTYDSIHTHFDSPHSIARPQFHLGLTSHACHTTISFPHLATSDSCTGC